MGRFIPRPSSDKELSKDEMEETDSDFVLDEEKTRELKALFAKASRVVGEECSDLDFLKLTVSWYGDGSCRLHADWAFGLLQECLEKLIARASAGTKDAKAKSVLPEDLL